MSFESFSNAPETTITSALTNVGTTVQVLSATGFPTSGNYRIIVDNEIMLVTAGQGTTSWSVIRGAEGTTAAPHLINSIITHVLTAAALSAFARTDVATSFVDGTAVSAAGFAFKGGEPWFDVKAFGATGNGKIVTDGAITTATAILTSATATFTSADVGKAIMVVGAGAAAANLVTTIAGFTNSTTVTLTVNASTTVVGSRTLTTGAMTAGQNILTSTGNFTASDLGKAITVIGAGTSTLSGGTSDLTTRIVSYIDANTVYTNDPCQTTVSGANVAVAGATVAYGTDDTTAVQTALTQALDGTLLFPSGIYMVPTWTTQNVNSALTIRGDALNKSIVVGCSTTQTFISGIANIGVRDISFQYFKYMFDFSRINSTPIPDYVTFERCRFTVFHNAIYGNNNTLPAGVKHLRVKDCEFFYSDIGGSGIYFDLADVQDALIDGNLIDGTQSRGLQLGNNSYPDAGSRGRYVVRGNSVKNVQNFSGAGATNMGIIVYGWRASITHNIVQWIWNNDGSNADGIYTKCRWSVIADNVLIDAGLSEGSIDIKGRQRFDATVGSPWGYAIICANNQIYQSVVDTSSYSNKYGIKIATSDVLCVNNYIEGVGRQSIYTDSGQMDNVQISGNMVRYNGGDTAIALFGTGSNIRVLDNHIVNVTGSGLSANTQLAGIKIQKDAASDIVIRGNFISQITDMGALGSSAGIIFKPNATQQGVRIQDNTVDTAPRGISWQATGVSDDVMVSMNRFISCTSAESYGGTTPTNFREIRSDPGEYTSYRDFTGTRKTYVDANQQWNSPAFASTGATGAALASRYAGATASGAPLSGTWLLGDYIIDQSGNIYVCTIAGTPGVWTSVGGVQGGAGGIGIYGTGVDGSMTLDGVNTYSGLSKVGSVYTMTTDIFPSSLTINVGSTLISNSFRMYVKNTLLNNGTISWNGNNGANGGAGAGAGGLALGQNTLGGGSGVSGPGTTSTTGISTPAATLSTAVGGIGGNGGSGGAGGGGNNQGTSFGVTNGRVYNLNSMTTGKIFGTSFGSINAGSGGGGGTGDTTSFGGGGGGGGGLILITAKTITNNGNINTLGGNGGNATAGNCGGGGGGGGGAILFTTASSISGSGATSNAGGTHGTGFGTGNNGQDGVTGQTITLLN